jgi:hypothetical protein
VHRRDQLQLGKTTNVQMRDGFQRYYTWRVNTRFPAINVVYFAAPLLTLTLTHGRNDVEARLREGTLLRCGLCSHCWA